jgi:predicted RNase H-like HicB family nuclease
MRYFVALIHKSPDSDYGVSFPDLPGCVTAGVDLAAARRMAEEALGLHLDGLEKAGEPIPEPSSLDDIMADRENQSGVPMLVEAQETIQRSRLRAVLSEGRRTPIASADVEGMAKKIYWAVTRLKSRTQLESVEGAKGEGKRAREIRRCAIKLARLLSTTPATLAASLEQSFDQERFVLTSPFGLQPMLRELGRGATRHVRRPPRAAVSKVTGRSPMTLFILEMAPLFEELTGEPAKVDRINADGDKGGPFPDFVRAVAQQWKIKPPSAAAIDQALRRT